MTTVLGIVLLIAAMVGMGCLAWSNALFVRVLREVNRKSEPKDRIDTPFIKHHVFAVTKRHRELYPDSTLPKRMSVTFVFGFLLFFAAFVGGVALDTDWSAGKTGSAHEQK